MRCPYNASRGYWKVQRMMYLDTMFISSRIYMGNRSDGAYVKKLNSFHNSSLLFESMYACGIPYVLNALENAMNVILIYHS